MGTWRHFFCPPGNGLGQAATAFWGFMTGAKMDTGMILRVISSTLLFAVLGFSALAGAYYIGALTLSQFGFQFNPEIDPIYHAFEVPVLNFYHSIFVLFAFVILTVSGKNRRLRPYLWSGFCLVCFAAVLSQFFIYDFPAATWSSAVLLSVSISFYFSIFQILMALLSLEMVQFFLNKPQPVSNEGEA